MRGPFVFNLVSVAAVLGLHGSVLMASIEPTPSGESWLPEPSWIVPTRPVPLAPTPARDVQPEPIPLPPAAVAVVAPALLTVIMARLSIKKRRPRARAMR